MRRQLRTAVRVAMSVAVAGGVMLATALPASADGGNFAFAAQDFDGTYGNLGQIALATDYNSPAVSSGIVLPGLLVTGRVLDRATPYLSSSQVGSVIVRVNSWVTLRLAGLSSWCRVGSSGLFGGSTLGGGSVLQLGGTTIALPSHPAPGTIVDFSGGSLVLNEQASSPGDISVTGIDISPGGGEHILVAGTYCNSFT